MLGRVSSPVDRCCPTGAPLPVRGFTTKITSSSQIPAHSRGTGHPEFHICAYLMLVSTVLPHRERSLTTWESRRLRFPSENLTQPPSNSTAGSRTLPHNVPTVILRGLLR